MIALPPPKLPVSSVQCSQLQDTVPTFQIIIKRHSLYFQHDVQCLILPRSIDLDICVVYECRILYKAQLHYGLSIDKGRSGYEAKMQ